VFVCSPVADVVNAYVNQPALAGSIQNTAIEIGGKHFWEQREYVELHGHILAASGLSGKARFGYISFDPLPWKSHPEMDLDNRRRRLADLRLNFINPAL
jgi:hypothetical protein